ncbi:hypothetical protein PG993_006013 [Apiospora rasikravindrae]|uniref:Uncharacterized protein n=1 Tax=Apiospora rasikravindrae TaxID=990691 RepID=A0ABR1TAH0_9PEZI
MAPGRNGLKPAARVSTNVVHSTSAPQVGSDPRTLPSHLVKPEYSRTLTERSQRPKADGKYGGRGERDEQEDFDQIHWQGRMVFSTAIAFFVSAGSYGVGWNRSEKTTTVIKELQPLG